MRGLWIGSILAVSLIAASALHTVSVCVEGAQVNFRTLQKALWIARDLYREIAVQIQRQCPADPRQGDVHIGFPKANQGRQGKFAVAYAMPYEGRTIRIFADRINRYQEPLRGDLLGHIIAHEVGHLLQGIDRHSEQGLMKATWDEDDHHLIRVRKLKFTSVDADLIHRGLGVRHSAHAGRVTKP
ncbi:MAG: hypothetical protein J0L64_07155 [Acidobacteria bacterium]|nr:hypothetical protein [Acidobacteriota bacterium]